MVTLNPDDCIPLGVHEGYKKLLTELFCGGLGVDKLDREALGRFKTLEVLWLNNNNLSKVKGLEDNFRLKHLYLHNNRITSLVNSSCCLKELRHLETLQLQGNMLQDLQATLKVLQKLTSLRQLNMQGNPLTNEQSYREWVVYSLPWIDILDNFRVTQFEKADAVKLFAAPKIEKKMAFGSVLEPWDKIIPNVKYAPSICESDLARDVGATHRRRGAAQREAEAVALRAAVRPRFDIKTLDGSESSYEFIAKGRVPTLLVRVGTLQIAPKVAAAAAVAAAGVVSGPAAAKVHVRINAMRILPQPTRTRAVDVTTAVLTSKREPPDFRFEEEILARHAAPAYERVMQLLQTGPDEELSLALQLCEDASGKVLGVSRVPISSLMRDTNSGRTEAVEATLREPGAGGAEVGRVSIAVTTDWNLACTSSDYLQHGRQRTRVATTASAAVARTMQQEAEDDAMGKRTKPPSSRLELAWQSVMSTAGIPAAARGGARFGAAHLLQVMQLMGSAATAADLDELLGTVTQPKLPKPATPAVSEFGGEAAPSPEPADAEAAEVAAATAAAAKPPPTATLAQFRRAIASFESRHAAAARECLEMGEIAEAHSHSQAALRISATLLAASEPPIEANSSKSATLTAAGRFAKDSFTMFRYERPAPGTAPDNLASSGSLKLDKPRYDAYLSKKALQAPARGSKFLMTI